MTVTMKITVFRDVRPSGLVKRNKCFGAMCCLILQNRYLSALKLLQHIPPKSRYRSTRPDDDTSQTIVTVQY